MKYSTAEIPGSPFAQALSDEDFKRIASISRINWRNADHCDRYERMLEAIASHLVSLRDRGVLSRLVVHPNRGLKFPRIWNAFLLGSDVPVDALTERIGDQMLERMEGTSRKLKDLETLKTSLSTAIEAGDLDVDFSEGEHCDQTGEPLRLRLLPGWKFRLESVVTGAEPVELPGTRIYQDSIPAPSGNFFVFDHQRPKVKAVLLAAGLDMVLDDRQSRDRQIELLDHCAKKHGVLHLYVGESELRLEVNGGYMLLKSSSDPSDTGNGALELGASRSGFLTIVDREHLLRAIEERAATSSEGEVAFGEFFADGAWSTFAIGAERLFFSVPTTRGGFKYFSLESGRLDMPGAQEVDAVFSLKPASWISI